ncbi:hypothetical protein CHS0354_012917 [Potamilus streckersoni]|uniref:Uncharacterized protein n=1 Tax=Potamilus streckersoni TaxID=2493646 RepID=A0AAE0RNU1_9BIVA|nr:hypothetical protein CHS0354_012917 [Potamilus streckersoni]
MVAMEEENSRPEPEEMVAMEKGKKTIPNPKESEMKSKWDYSISREEDTEVYPIEMIKNSQHVFLSATGRGIYTATRGSGLIIPCRRRQIRNFDWR